MADRIVIRGGDQSSRRMWPRPEPRESLCRRIVRQLGEGADLREMFRERLAKQILRRGSAMQNQRDRQMVRDAFGSVS